MTEKIMKEEELELKSSEGEAESTEEQKETAVEKNEKNAPKKNSSKKKGPLPWKKSAKTKGGKKSSNYYLPTLEQLINEKTIFTGTVVGTDYDSESKTESMTVRLPENVLRQTVDVVIKRDEADNIFRSGTLNYLVGHKVPFVVIGREDDVIYGSRRIAQDLLREQLRERFEKKEVFNAEILSFTPYGSFVSVNGVVGMMRNKDFSLDHTPVSDVYKSGDRVRVICQAIVNEAGKIYFEPEKKYYRPQAAVPNFSVGSVKIGEVVSMRFFSQELFAFVRVEKGIDVMAQVPYGIELNIGQNCKVQITSIKEPEKPLEPVKVKGIVRGIV